MIHRVRQRRSSIRGGQFDQELIIIRLSSLTGVFYEQNPQQKRTEHRRDPINSAGERSDVPAELPAAPAVVPGSACAWKLNVQHHLLATDAGIAEPRSA